MQKKETFFAKINDMDACVSFHNKYMIHLLSSGEILSCIWQKWDRFYCRSEKKTIFWQKFIKRAWYKNKLEYIPFLQGPIQVYKINYR